MADHAPEPPGTHCDEELDRVAALRPARSSPWEGVRSDILQGMCAALAMGPDDAPAERWKTVATGTAEAALPPEVGALLATALARTRADLEADTFVLRLAPLRRGRLDYAAWCGGFLDGVELSEAGWHDSADPEDVEELLFPIYALAGELSEAERARFSAAGWRKLVLDAERELPQLLRRLRDYWAIVRQPPATVRHASRKPGRNEPCTCGSGRKYKHCCGA